MLVKISTLLPSFFARQHFIDIQQRIFYTSSHKKGSSYQRRKLRFLQEQHALSSNKEASIYVEKIWRLHYCFFNDIGTSRMQQQQFKPELLYHSINAGGCSETVDNIQSLSIVSKDANDFKAEYLAGFIQGKLAEGLESKMRVIISGTTRISSIRHIPFQSRFFPFRGGI